MLKRITLKEAAGEPFRFFFPQGVLAGLIGVSLWPLYFWHITSLYPGVAHVRIMTAGFFGAFIIGFLGTSMPRMLSAAPLSLTESLSLLGLHAAMVGAYSCGGIATGDALFLLLLGTTAACLARRLAVRQDVPPPGFVLVALAFLSVISGTVIALVASYRELDAYWLNLHRLLSTQGFVLLPILGIGPFILPRFFGRPSSHDFPEARIPSKLWWRKASLALLAGSVIVASLFVEASGAYRVAYALRTLATVAYLILEFPFKASVETGNAFTTCIQIAVGGMVAGFVAVWISPQFHVALLHLTLVGGFALIMLVVATRVILGHSGNMALLKQPNKWFYGAVAIMLFAMATRVSGDFWPRIMVSHYIYGAILWAIGVLIWSWRVLRRVTQTE